MKVEKAQRHLLKIIAIFFAVSLWFYVLNSEPVEIEKKIQVDFVLPEGFAISSNTERQLSVKLKGSKAFIGNVYSNKEKITVDLNPYYKKYGKNFKVQFLHSQLTVPFGVNILDLEPKEMSVSIDRLASVELPIKVIYIGKLGYDKKFVELEMEPKNIMVSGPIDVIRKYSRVETAPINLTDIVKDEGEISVALDDLDLRLKFEENPKVNIKYKVNLSIPKRESIKK